VSAIAAAFITATILLVYSASTRSRAHTNKGEKNKGKNDLLGSYYLGHIS
jgi:hypothetical protein